MVTFPPPPPPIIGIGWRNYLRDASFRGVPFKVLSVESGVGRRTVLHQYPFQDEPYVEDLGLDADEYNIEGYILSASYNNYNYFSDRDDLIDALKESGPGTLVHPFYGELTVALSGKAIITESFAEGGIARLRMTFVRAEEVKYPTTIMDHLTMIDDIAQYALDLTKDNMGTNYDSAGPMLGWVLGKTGEQISSLHTMMRATMGMIQGSGRSSIMNASNILDDINITQARIGSAPDLISILEDTFNSPLSLAGLYGRAGLKGILGTYSQRVRSYQFAPLNEEETSYGTVFTKQLGTSVVYSLLELCKFGELVGSSNVSLYGGDFDGFVVNSTNRAKQWVSQNLIIIFVRSLAIIDACRIAVRIKYSSSQEAIAMMEDIVTALDAHLVLIGEGLNPMCYYYGFTLTYDDFFAGIQALRSTLVRILIDMGASLANIQHYIVGTDNMSTLQLAHDLYDNLDREVDIIDRNTPGLIKHPGFLPGGTYLEVLSA